MSNYKDIESQTKHKNKIEKKDDEILRSIPIIIGFTVLFLLLMGHPLYNSTVKLWSSNNKDISQNIFDPYSFIHIIQGMIHYNVVHNYQKNNHL